MQIEESIVSKINECHQEFLAIGQRNVEGIVEQINKAREIGIYLQGFKEELKKTRDENGNRILWEKQFSSTRGKSETNFTFGFDYRTGHNYIRVAKILPEPITSLPEGVRVLSDVFRMSNALPEPEGRGAETAHEPEFFSKTVKHLSGFLATVSKWREGEPLEKWSAKRREDLRDQIRPVVEFYEALS